MLISDLHDYCDSNIAVNGAIGIISPSANDNNKAEKGFTFKSKASFTSWISKINNTKKLQTTAIWLSKCVICQTIYNENCSMALEIFQNYCKDKMDGNNVHDI